MRSPARRDALAGAGEHERGCRAATGARPSWRRGIRRAAVLGGARRGDLGDIDGGVRLVAEAIAVQPGWLELLGRLTADAAPGVEQVRARRDSAPSLTACRVKRVGEALGPVAEAELTAVERVHLTGNASQGTLSCSARPVMRNPRESSARDGLAEAVAPVVNDVVLEGVIAPDVGPRLVEDERALRCSK